MNMLTNTIPVEPIHHGGGETTEADRATQVRASTAARCLEAAWARIREIEPRVPAVVLIPIDVRGRARKLGHFSGSSWQSAVTSGAHEVAISPALFRLPEQLLETLLHEAAHGILFEHAERLERHVAGCGPGGYHRREFRDECQKLGLECLFRNKRAGWANTQWPEAGIPERYVPVLDLLRKGMPDGTRPPTLRRFTPRALPNSGHVRLVCGCATPRSIYVTPTLASQRGVVCRRCAQEFRLPCSAPDPHDGPFPA